MDSRSSETSPRFQRSFASCGNLSEITATSEGVQRLPTCKNELQCNWFLNERSKSNRKVCLPMKSFNHIAREVLSLDKSYKFYVDILGFDVIPRPPFDSEGYWLNGYGLNLHLISTTVPKERMKLKSTRIHHFSSALPRVDHMAFITDDLTVIRETLDKEKVYYKADTPAEGISQIFFFDPDGNVIEVSNCCPEVGEITCRTKDGVVHAFTAESDEVFTPNSAVNHNSSHSNNSSGIDFALSASSDSAF